MRRSGAGVQPGEILKDQVRSGVLRMPAPAAATLAIMAIITLGASALPVDTPGRQAVLTLLFTAAPLLAAITAYLACRAMPGATGQPWLLVAAAAAAGLMTHAVVGFGAGEAAHVLLHVAAMAGLAGALGWILHQRDRGRLVEIGLDAGLVVAAATVVTLHWSPAAREVLTNGVADPLARLAGIFAAPIAAGCAFLLAAVLLVVRDGTPAVRAAPALAAATALFGLAVAPLALGAGWCCGVAHLSGLAYAFGWLCVAYAGVRTMTAAPDGFVHEGVDGGGSRLRLVVAPTVALVMGAVLVDGSWRAPLLHGTAVALAVLGLLLALRVSQLLYATRSHSEERLKLGQSRALIEVSHALSGTRELEEALELVAYWAVQLLQARGATIELLTEDGEWLEQRAAMGSLEASSELRLPVAASFTGWVVRHGRPRATADSSTDRTVHPDSRKYLGNAPMAAVPLRYGDRTFGALTCVGRYPFSATDMELLGAFAEQAAVAIETARLFRQVHHLSMTDPLTGLANRRQLDRDLAREFAAAQRGRQLVAVMFDLNEFKRFNDSYGHLAGDEALRRFGAALSESTRAMNIAARYGGDEFIALLADAPVQGAEVFIERVRERFPGPDADERFAGLSVAAGIASYDASMKSPEELVAAADRALYENKAAGRAVASTSR
jgi:diguanylate cyclase (GGDEF)-like protein